MSGVSGDLAFTDLDIFTANGAGLNMTGTGAVNIAAGTGMRMIVGAGVATIDATGGPAAQVSSATIDLQFVTVKSVNSTSSGVSLTGINDGTTTSVFSAGAGSSISNAAGVDFIIDSNNATVTYAGTINDDIGQLVSVTNNTGDSKSFTGAITDGNDGDGNGVSLTNNTGTTITFSGGLVLSTGSNPAFTATGGGTINVCDENPCNPSLTGTLVNTLATTTGIALNVANTTIGSNKLEFQSISANGAANGIILNNTGSIGGLTVSGNGGTCTAANTSGCSGGTIQNTTGGR